MKTYEEFVEHMESKYPKMFSEQYGGFDIGEGWWHIVSSLCAQIQEHIDWWNKNRKERPVVEQVIVSQVKEKFGGLRFYYDGVDEKISGMVQMAEVWASHTCEVCGKPGHSRGGSYIQTLCDEHAKPREKPKAPDWHPV